MIIYWIDKLIQLLFPLFACPKSGAKKTPMCSKAKIFALKPKTDAYGGLKQSNVSVF